jgi:hypothetical protein
MFPYIQPEHSVQMTTTRSPGTISTERRVIIANPVVTSRLLSAKGGDVYHVHVDVHVHTQPHARFGSVFNPTFSVLNHIFRALG